VESGYVSQPLPATGADSGTGNTFYQLTFKAGQDYASLTATDPLIIWLNGGPGKMALHMVGCASQFGLYGEIGPFVVSNGTAADTFTIALRVPPIHR
jgi:carboxypeptidase C (cathepsin A)